MSDEREHVDLHTVLSGRHADHHEPVHDEHGADQHAPQHLGSGYPSRSARRLAEQEQHQHHHARRRRRRGRRGVVILVALLVVALGAFGAFSVLRPLVKQLTAPKDYSGNGSGTVSVTIADGASGRMIGRTLEKAGVVKTADAFVDAAAAQPKSASIQPGQYTLHRHMSAAAAVTMLLDPSSRSADRVTIREGLRATDVIALLAKKTGQPLADYQKAIKDPESLGVPASAKGKVEGWLFPDTYEFGTEKSASQQLAMMVGQTKRVLGDLGVPDSQAQTVLTKASIVQAEGGSEADFGKIATVIDARLADKLHNGGKLQMDSTVAYGTGKNGIFTTSAERADTSNPYNTYAHAGLPVGPIGNPGKAAIEAALHPTPGPWLYFVVVNLDTGETKFATTLAEHNQYVQQFQKWYAANR